nr:hypothetical protein [Pyrinomonadaceae bacterium]
ITQGGELSESYSVENNHEVKMTKAELITLIEEAGFEAIERDTLYNIRKDEAFNFLKTD